MKTTRPDPCHLVRLHLAVLVLPALQLLLPPPAKAQLPRDRPVPTQITMPLDPVEPDEIYGVEDAFPGLIFDNPLAIVTPPGETNRLFVVEQKGLIRVIPDLTAPVLWAEDFLDLREWVESLSQEQGCLGLAFHPAYASNGHFYVSYTGVTNTTTGTGTHDILSRFTVSATNANRAVLGSATPLLAQFDEHPSHNAGCLAFGPDGYLYYSAGDEGAIHLGNNQRVDKDFFGGIFRLDVDLRPGNLNPNPHPAVVGPYRVPANNPFVGADSFNGLPVIPAQVRTEFYAVGLRNPWKFSFDPATGDLYCGDVGHEAWEEVDRILPGANYGYPYREGRAAGPLATTPPPGFAPVEPLLDYAHPASYSTLMGNCVVYGFVYRGTRFPALRGRHILGDFSYGNLWSVPAEGPGAWELNFISRNGSFMSTFGEDPRNGDILIGRYLSFPWKISRLVSARPPGEPWKIPETLAETGLFADIESLTPAAGVVPYEVNQPFWSDGAIKRRWFYTPTTDTVFHADGNGELDFPPGTVWVKHFDLPLSDENTQDVMRVETRVLVKTTNSVYGVSYRYGNSTTNAVRVPIVGFEEDIAVRRGGQDVLQHWVYPSDGSCLYCHNAAAGLAIGFQPVQLDREVPVAGGGFTNQLEWLANLGYLDNPEACPPGQLRLARAGETNVSLEHQARSMLHANCAHCHRPGGPVPTAFDLRVEPPLESVGILGVASASAPPGSGLDIVHPGRSDLSHLLARMSNQSIRMPPLGSQVIDTNTVESIRAWIDGLAGFQPYAEWAALQWGTAAHPDALRELDPDADGATNLDEYYAGSDPRQPDAVARLQVSMAGQGQPLLSWLRPAGARTLLEVSPSLGAGESWSPATIPGNEMVPPGQDLWMEGHSGDTESPHLYFRLRTVPR